MTSEIRANTLKNRVGLGTVSFTNTGPIVSGIVTANSFSGPYNGTDIVGTGITLTSTDTGSSAGPELKLFRNSASPADADYLGQVKFAGESDTGVERNYAKITGKILDASNGTEDGILEFAHIKGGSQTITGRWRSDSLQLLNSTNFSVAGTSEFTGDATFTGDLHINAAVPLIRFTDSDTGQYSDILQSGNSLYLSGDRGASGSGGIIFRTQGTNEKVRITSDGKVGINRTTPAAPITARRTDAGGTGTSGVIAEFANSSGYGVWFGQSSASGASWGATTGDFYWNTGGLSSQVERLRIDSAGRIGIGENSPGSYSSGAYNLVISAPSGSNSGITINSDSGGTDSGAIFFSHGTASGANGVGRIRYYHSDDHMDFYTANAERLRITSTGRVSVGANNQSYGRLQVNQTSDDDEAGIAVLNSGGGRSLRIYCDSSNNAVFNSGNAGSGQINFNESKLILTSTGTVLKGLTTARQNYSNNTSGVEYGFQIESTNATKSSLSLIRSSNDANDGGIFIGKTRSTSVGGNTAVQAGDDLGTITFGGADGTSLLFGAEIIAEAQSGVGNDDMPTDLIFKTNGGSTNTVERLRIDSSGRVMIGTTTEGNSNADDLTVANSGEGGITIRSGSSSNGNIFFSDATSGAGEYAGFIDYKHSSNVMTFGTNGSERVRIDSSGRVGINETSPDSMLHVRNDNSYAAKFGGHGGGSEYYIEIGQLATSGSAGFNATGVSGSMLFRINGSEKLRIDPSGNVMINRTSSAKRFSVKETSTSSGVYYNAHIGGASHLANYAVGIGFDPEGYSARTKIGIVAEGTSSGYSRGKLHFLLDNANDSGEATLSEARMTINDSGQVTIPNQPSFHARLQNHTNATQNPLYFDNVLVNVGSHYKTSGSDQGKFVVPVAGTYFFFWEGIKNNLDGSVTRLYLQKNGSRTYNNMHLRLQEEGRYSNGCMNVIMTLAVGDKIHIELAVGGVHGSEYTHFGGYLIG